LPEDSVAVGDNRFLSGDIGLQGIRAPSFPFNPPPADWDGVEVMKTK